MRTTRDEVLEEVVKANNLGEDVRVFWQSPVGRYLQSRIDEVELRYLDESASLGTTQASLDVARQEYVIGKRIAVWLGEALAAGMEARELLELDIEENTDPSDLLEAGESDDE